MMSLASELYTLIPMVLVFGILCGLFLGRRIYRCRMGEKIGDRTVVINKKMLGEHGFAMLVPGTYHISSDAKIHSITVKKGAHLNLGGNTVVGTVYADGIVDGGLGK